MPGSVGGWAVYLTWGSNRCVEEDGVGRWRNERKDGD